MNNYYKNICESGDFIKLSETPTNLLTPNIINEMIKYLENTIKKLECLMICDTDNSSMFSTIDHQKCLTYLKNINKKMV
jgi:hypothetical protein